MAKKKARTFDQIKNLKVSSKELANIKFFVKMSPKAKKLINDHLAQIKKSMDEINYQDLADIKKILEDAKSSKAA